MKRNICRNTPLRTDGDSISPPPFLTWNELPHFSEVCRARGESLRLAWTPLLLFPPDLRPACASYRCTARRRPFGRSDLGPVWLLIGARRCRAKIEELSDLPQQLKREEDAHAEVGLKQRACRAPGLRLAGYEVAMRLRFPRVCSGGPARDCCSRATRIRVYTANGYSVDATCCLPLWFGGMNTTSFLDEREMGNTYVMGDGTPPSGVKASNHRDEAVSWHRRTSSNFHWEKCQLRCSCRAVQLMDACKVQNM